LPPREAGIVEVCSPPVEAVARKGDVMRQRATINGLKAGSSDGLPWGQSRQVLRRGAVMQTFGLHVVVIVVIASVAAAAGGAFLGLAAFAAALVIGGLAAAAAGDAELGSLQEVAW
jgi:hypothetical protein